MMYPDKSIKNELLEYQGKLNYIIYHKYFSNPAGNASRVMECSS